MNLRGRARRDCAGTLRQTFADNYCTPRGFEKITFVLPPELVRAVLMSSCN